MDVDAALRGEIHDPWLKRFFAQVGTGLSRFSMIRDGDRILLGISGGKDSLVLAFALSARLRWIRDTYSLEALLIEWEEYPLSEPQRLALEQYFERIGVPFSITRSRMAADRRGEPFTCYRCSRRKKELLFTEARKRGIRTVALGHHLDDIIETTLINLSFHGTFSTMMPVQDFFNGEITLIRPLCEVRESVAGRVARELLLPVVPGNCPFRDTNLRAAVKPVVAQLSRLNRRARENLYRASWNIRRDYLPDILNDPPSCTKLTDNELK